MLTENIKKAQEAYTFQANKKRKPDPECKIGSKVWLKTTNICANRPSKKFDYRKLGPFKIIKKINPVCYRIELLETMHIYNVFYTWLLEEVIHNDLSNRHQPTPLPTEVDGHEEYDVEAILFHRLHRGHIQWKGYGPEANAWEPRKNLKTNLNQLESILTACDTASWNHCTLHLFRSMTYESASVCPLIQVDLKAHRIMCNKFLHI
jgi:hypothetical protein